MPKAELTSSRRHFCRTSGGQRIKPITFSIVPILAAAWMLLPFRASAAPSIDTQPQSQTVCQGSAVTFTVSASGNGTRNYQWLKNGAYILGATSDSFTIDPAQIGDQGDYAVVVTDDGGPIASNPATLTVDPASAGGTATPAASTVCGGTGT